MANPDIRISVTADDDASSKLNKVGDAVDDVGHKGTGAKGKLGGLTDSLSGLGVTSGAVAAGGVAAIAAGLAASVMAFSDAALAAGKSAEATGLNVEEYSRLKEVAGDLGIGTDALDAMLSKLGKTLGASPEKFAALGIEIAKTDTGATDIQGTFENVVDRLNAIEDPAARAKAASDLLGKGWTQNAELIALGGDKIREAMAAVSDAKVIDDAEVEKAKKMREAMDTLADAGQDVMLILGEALIPVVTALAENLGGVAENVGPLAELVGKALAGALKLLSPIIDYLVMQLEWMVKGLTKVGEVAESVIGFIAGEAIALDGLTAAVAAAAPATVELALSEEELAAQAQEAADAAAELKAELEEQTKQLEANLEAQLALSAAMRAATDSAFAVADAGDNYAEHLADLDKKLEAAEGDQRKINAVYRDGASAAADLATKTAEHAAKVAEANGETLSATESLDLFNESMLTSAATASGPQRQAILDYIASVNGIPESKATAIAAAIEAGDIEEAERLLTETSRNRTATVAADTDAAELAATEAELEQLTRPRTVTVTPIGGSKGGGLSYYAEGTSNHPGGLAVINEKGGEIVDLPSGARVYPADVTRRMVEQTAPAGGTYVDSSTTIYHLPPGITPEALSAGNRRWTKRGGR